ncbi:PAS domain S-box protein [Methanospirillum stamsii]|uniref:histidine kinase n=1 Tax=Methanospirillum stamsii TaxID=1277351 RepID=A0A2V2NCE6_9EURY|nr:PAS domain-containing sensor histidine kinase [Methanospirillum stamsii]PWR76255.1 hypothetical protein DLD82_00125 [Methanospirillum stamsii]
MKERWNTWRKEPVSGAFLISILFALILFPYWWLLDQWSRTFFIDHVTQFTFTSTTFIVVLAIIDSTFLIRYYQILQKNKLAHAMNEICENAENCRAMVENAPFPIIVTKYLDNSILVMNKEAKILFLENPEDNVEKKISEEFLSIIKTEHFSDTLPGKKQVFGYEISFDTKTRGTIYTSLSANVIDFLGERAIFTAFVDITDRIALEREILRREEKFSTFFHEVPNPLLILSDTGHILEVNSGCEQYFGLKKEDIITKKLDELIIFSEFNQDSITQLKETKLSSIETLIELPDGQKRYVILHIRLISIRNITHTLLLIQDIDEIKRVQNAISQANNQLSILNSITRHDILNRIMIITSFGQLLEKKISDEPEKRWISIILQSAEDIHTLIDFTRQYQDLGLHEPKWQDVSEIMQKSGIRSLLSDISLHLPDESIEIYADPMLEKVLYNLVDNSVRHGERVTDITLSYKKNGDNLVLRYEDNGIGIDEKDKKNIFTKGFGKNTGLGLFLIREILSLTNITITEHGEKDTGVRFDMKIPSGTFRTVTKEAKTES